MISQFVISLQCLLKTLSYISPDVYHEPLTSDSEFNPLNFVSLTDIRFQFLLLQGIDYPKKNRENHVITNPVLDK